MSVNQVNLLLADNFHDGLNRSPGKVVLHGGYKNSTTHAPQSRRKSAFVGVETGDPKKVGRQLLDQVAHVDFHSPDTGIAQNFEHVKRLFLGIAWGDVWMGATVTALLFTIGKFLIGLYLGQSAVSSSYGAAGALVVILVWIYYSAQILFFGAEFTQVYAKRFGSHIKPAADAIPVTEEARAQQGMPRREKEAPTAATPREPAQTLTHPRPQVRVTPESRPKPATFLISLIAGIILERMNGKKDEKRVAQKNV